MTAPTLKRGLRLQKSSTHDSPPKFDRPDFEKGIETDHNAVVAENTEFDRPDFEKGIETLPHIFNTVSCPV